MGATNKSTGIPGISKKREGNMWNAYYKNPQHLVDAGKPKVAHTTLETQVEHEAQALCVKIREQLDSGDYTPERLLTLPRVLQDAFTVDVVRTPVRSLPAAMDIAGNFAEENRLLKDKVRSLEGRLTQALRLLEKMGVSGECPHKTLTDALNDFLSDDKNKTGTPETGKNEKDQIRRIINRFIKTQEGRMLQEITLEHVKTFLNDMSNGTLERQRQKPEPKSIRRECANVSRFLHHQSKKNFKADEIMEWVEMFHADPKGLTKKVPLWLTHDQVMSLYAVMPEPWREIMLVQWATGMNPAELCRLTLDCIVKDDGETFLQVKELKREGVIIAQKRDKRIRKCLVPQFAIASLNALVLRATDILVPNKDGEKWNEKDFSMAYNPILQSAGAMALKGVALKDAKGKNRLIGYTMRHSFAKFIYTARKADGTKLYDIDECAKIMGNTPGVFRTSYAWLVDGDVKQVDTRSANVVAISA